MSNVCVCFMDAFGMFWVRGAAIRSRKRLVELPNLRFGFRGGLYVDVMLGEESGEGLARDPARAAAWAPVFGQEMASNRGETWRKSWRKELKRASRPLFGGYK